MLSLLKMASAFVFVRRSCSSRSLLIASREEGAQPAQDPSPPWPVEHGALGGNQLTVIAALEDLVVWAHDPTYASPGRRP